MPFDSLSSVVGVKIKNHAKAWIKMTENALETGLVKLPKEQETY